MFALREIHQIEITSRCNLRCRYCPSPKLPRPKVDMTEDTFKRTLEWVRVFSARGTQTELNLAGIGESTMHPDFVRFVFLAREALRPDQPVVVATNGLLMTDELARELQPSGIRVWVSLHRPEKAGPAVEHLKRYGLLSGVSADPSLAAIDWAGQVNWHRSSARMACPWVKGGWAFVLSDGSLSRCCIDASGVGVFGHVNDVVTDMETSPYVLCRTCDHDVGVAMENVA
jgi:hypothetical protein